MAVTLKGNNGTYEGTSEDSKPLDVPVNTEFDELDTGKTYYFNGETWNEEPPCEGSGFTPTAEQLAAMNSGVTTEDVEQIATNENNISSQQNSVAEGGQGYAIINGQRLYMGESMFGSNVPTYSIGYFGGLQYSYRAATEVITPPTTIYANGTTATFALKGNGVSGVGEVTANLFDAATVYGAMYDTQTGILVGNAATLTAIKNKFTSEMVGIPVTIKIRALNVPVTRVYIRCTINGENVDSNNIATGNTGTMTVTVTPTSTTDDWRISYGTGFGDITVSEIMLNTGSTSLPYEPYGEYKIPVTINSTTTNIFIGDNPLRKSLDGTAVDELAADGTLTRRVDSDGSVLATPVVTQITMPTFTTADGANAISIDTTVQPSEVSATWTGWHLL